MCSSGGFPDHSYRWNMSVEDSVYCKDKARTLSSMKELCKKSGQNCSKHKGCIHPPLLNVEPSAVVLDELHLMLRIGDVLIRNLILYAHSRDHRSQERLGETTHHIQELETAIRSCGVSFHIWQKREPTGKPIPGSYDWTALTGTHKLKVLQRLPEMMNKILPDAVCGRIVHLWNVSEWS